MSTLTLLQAKDTNGVTTSGKRPRGRPRKLPAANRRDSGVANDVDRGGGGDGDGELGGDSRRGEDADMLKEILLDNCDDKEEDDHVGDLDCSHLILFFLSFPCCRVKANHASLLYGYCSNFLPSLCC